MQHQNTICHALLKAVPRHRFDRLVEAHRSDYRVRRLPCWSQFVALIYAQLSGAQSLRELIVGLGSHHNLLYHLGVNEIRRSTLSDANRDRSPTLFSAVFGLLAAKLTGKLGREAREVVRLIDATALPLNETLSSWAHFSAGRTAAKLHLVYDPSADCPTYFSLTPARVNDIVEAKQMPIDAGATYVFDKGYYDFGWWAALNAAGCRFVTRLKKNSPVQLVEERPAHGEGIESDRLVRLSQRLAASRKNPYQETLREIVVVTQDGKRLRLVTNDLDAPASEIAALYKTRWQVELFFKWVKQNLRIKKFLGTSQNAVKLQIITALIAYMLIRVSQQALPSPPSMQHLARLMRANLMHRKTVPELLAPPPLHGSPGRQLALTLTYAHA